MSTDSEASHAIVLNDESLRHALSVLSKLLSAKGMQTADKLSRVRGAVVRNGVVTLTLDTLFGQSCAGAPYVRVSYRVTDAEADDDDDDGGESCGSEAEDDGMTKEGGPKKYDTALARARCVFQSRAVVDALIAAAGPHLHAVNKALSDAIIAKNVASKRRRTELHEMPAEDDTPAVARRKLSLVAQQAIGAAWTLTRASVPGPREAVETAMQAFAADLRVDAQALFALPAAKDVFDEFVDCADRFRACATCHTMGCLQCRKPALV